MPWHVTLASADRFNLFPRPAERLAAARVIARLAHGRALLFCAVDDHVHVVVDADRSATSHMAGALHVALARPDVPLGRAFVRPVDDRAHLVTLVGYVLRQPVSHGLDAHPARWEGSCAWDLLGARVLEHFSTEALRAALPRQRPEEVWRALDLPRAPAPLGDDELVECSPAHLARAVGAAAGIESLTRPSRATTRARTVFVHLAGVARTADAAAGLLGIDPRSVRRLRERQPDPALTRAARVWLDVDRLAQGRARAGARPR